MTMRRKPADRGTLEGQSVLEIALEDCSLSEHHMMNQVRKQARFPGEGTWQPILR